MQFSYLFCVQLHFYTDCWRLTEVQKCFTKHPSVCENLLEDLEEAQGDLPLPTSTWRRCREDGAGLCSVVPGQEALGMAWEVLGVLAGSSGLPAPEPSPCSGGPCCDSALLAVLPQFSGPGAAHHLHGRALTSKRYTWWRNPRQWIQLAEAIQIPKATQELLVHRTHSSLGSSQSSRKL